MPEKEVETATTRRRLELTRQDVELSLRSAYLAMFRFLDAYWERTGSDEIGGLLSGMAINLGDGGTMDPGARCDWLEAVADVRRQATLDGQSDVAPARSPDVAVSSREGWSLGGDSDTLSTRLAYVAMCRFLEVYWQRGGNDEVAEMLGRMTIGADGAPAALAAWDAWLVAVADDKRQPDLDVPLGLDDPWEGAPEREPLRQDGEHGSSIWTRPVRRARMAWRSRRIR